METGEHALLQCPVEIDEDVAAEQQVEPGDGSVRDQVVHPEYHRAPDLLSHAPARRVLDEPGLEDSGGNGFHLLARVHSVSRERDRLLVHVGPEDLHLLVLEGGSHRLRQQDADGERLLAGRGPGEEAFSIGILLAEAMRSEEHTSELQSRLHLVCRLLLEKKKKVLVYMSAVAPDTPLALK